MNDYSRTSVCANGTGGVGTSSPTSVRSRTCSGRACSPVARRRWIIKELWTYLLGYNLIRLLACEAARVRGCEPRAISFRHTARLWSAWAMLGEELDERRWRLLLERIGQRRVRNRPGRREPRAIKRRPKPRSLLDLP